MKKILSLVLSFTILTALAAVFPSMASAKDYPKIANIYMAEKFLADDTKPAGSDNRSPWIGTSHEILFEGQPNTAYLDKNDKKQGNSSLAQKVIAGGTRIDYWLAGAVKFDLPNPEAPGIDVSACKNPGLSFWFYVSDPKALGGDRSLTNSEYGSFIVDFGEESAGGINGQKNSAFWLNADQLNKGWNQIVIPCKPGAVDSATTAFLFDSRAIGYRKTEQDLNYKALNWFRVSLVSKAALIVKLDDFKFVDLGNDTTTPYKEGGAATSTTPSKASQAAAQSTAQTNSTAAPTESDTVSNDDTVSDPTESDDPTASEDETSTDTVSSKKADDKETNGKEKPNVLLYVGLGIFVIAILAGFAGVMIFVVVPKMVKAKTEELTGNNKDGE